MTRNKRGPLDRGVRDDHGGQPLVERDRDDVVDVGGFKVGGDLQENRFRRPGGLRRRDAVEQIGRASCRERVCQYVSISVVAVSLKKKKQNKHSKLTITTHTQLVNHHNSKPQY